ncbi:hypothetical protein SUGI_0118440 [Cryptomeria japonica]|uniref:large ribosomal subunit protein cL37 alpha n=1 Tax=Cryptomeria japonica TaxID=3369 RepID=UPI002408C048|nr:large ribosomal subunit protein cL37 alpha [Cryptomeria japonica]GLJ09926.1 hypothetical protein SUGI_0118440 [Cryptomeria japonica]
MPLVMAATSTPASGLSSSHLRTHTSPTSYFVQSRPLKLTVASKFSVGFLNTNHNANAKFTAFSKGLKPSGFELCISSGLAHSCTHVTVCLAAAAGDSSSVDGSEGEGRKEGSDVGKGEQKLKLVSEAALLRRKEKNLRQRKRRLRLKRKLRKKGSWPPSKMKKLRKV